MISLPVLAAEQSAGQTETLTQFVQQSWKVQGFQLDRDSVLSMVPLRVSTYSTPAFIHRSQLEKLRSKSQELAGLCERQGGQWHYLGMPMADKPTLGRPLSSGSAMADAIERAPVTEADMRDLVKTGEQGIAADIAKAMVQTMLRQPDPLVAEALEYAVRMKWLGRFKCQREAAAWWAEISYAKWANHADRGLIYKDVTLKVELAEGK